MKRNRSMKFVISYSGGKDSALALYRMIQRGHEPVCMVVTFNEEKERSWFHGIDSQLLEQISESLGIPLVKCRSNGDDYNAAFEECLKKAKEMGAEACVFGDIDIEGHLQWDQRRCEIAELECVTPLWQEDRERVVCELIDSGFQAVIKCVQNQYLSKDFLGKTLTREVMAAIAETGADVCGENGEYHTLVCDGPIFSRPVAVKHRDIIDSGTHSALDMSADL